MNDEEFTSFVRIDSNAAKEEFNGILKWIDQLNEVNTDNVKPLVSVNEDTIICRDDIVDMQNTKEDILSNAPQSQYGYFIVPKVVE